MQRNIEQKKLIRFELTKVQRNVEKSYQTRWLQMHYSILGGNTAHIPSLQRLIKYATTNLRRNVFRLILILTNSVRTCVTYGRTPNAQTELLQRDNKLRRNVNETTKIALTYGKTLRRQD